jgi:acyl dehydratase
VAEEAGSMEENKILTDGMLAQVGKQINTQVTQIDQRLLDQYLEATGDSNPIYRDKAAALQAEYADIPVPPGLLITMQMEGGSPSGYMREQKHLGGAVDGGGEWEFYHPVYLGDVIAATRKLLATKEREGKLGRMIINTFEVTYQNQRSRIVARGQWSTVRYSTKA